MKGKTRFVCLALVTLLFILPLFGKATAADFSKGTVSFVVPYPPGGVTDAIARMFAQVFSKYIKQTTMVVNKPGAGTALGTLEVVNANPDGHTLGVFSNALLASQYVLPEPVDLKGLEPVALFNFDPNTIGVYEQLPFQSINDMVSFAQKNPKKLKVGIHSGTGTAHLYMVAFMKKAGIDAEANYIAFKGGGDAKAALAGGHIDVATDVFGVFRPLVDAKKVRILAVARERRHPLYPNVPTLKEQGYDISWGTFHGIFTTKGTPPEIIQILEKAIESTTKDKEFLSLMEKNQFPVEFRDLQKFKLFLKNEDKVYKEIATEVGLYPPKK